MALNDFEEMFWKAQRRIAYVAIVIAAIGWIWGCIVSSQLAGSRHELEQVRTELARTVDRQQDIADIVGRTGVILDESADTVQGIREQIRVIRKSYEEMEAIIYGSRDGDVGSDRHSNN